jgi:hypothetical protein
VGLVGPVPLEVEVPKASHELLRLGGLGDVPKRDAARHVPRVAAGAAPLVADHENVALERRGVEVQGVHAFRDVPESSAVQESGPHRVRGVGEVDHVHSAGLALSGPIPEVREPSPIGRLQCRHVRDVPLEVRELQLADGVNVLRRGGQVSGTGAVLVAVPCDAGEAGSLLRRVVVSRSGRPEHHRCREGGRDGDHKQSVSRHRSPSMRSFRKRALQLFCASRSSSLRTTTLLCRPSERPSRSWRDRIHHIRLSARCTGRCRGRCRNRSRAHPPARRTPAPEPAVRSRPAQALPPGHPGDPSHVPPPWIVEPCRSTLRRSRPIGSRGVQWCRCARSRSYTTGRTFCRGRTRSETRGSRPIAWCKSVSDGAGE